jgi:hypothetical protein
LNCTPAKIISSNSVNKVSANTIEVTFNVNVYPNPSQGIFNVKVQSPNKESIILRVIDSQGKTFNSIKASPYTNTVIGRELRPGVYFLEATQGNNKKYIKLIKQ